MNKKLNSVINYPALIVIIIYPLILGVIATLYGYRYGIGKFEIISIIATYYISIYQLVLDCIDYGHIMHSKLKSG